MEIDYKKVHKSAEQLRKSAERLNQFHAKKRPTRTGQLSKRDSTTLERLEKNFAAANATVRTALPAVAMAAAPLPDPAARFDFDKFFAEIADGFISAQSKLDAASAQYLKQVSGQQHVLPSVFRIPKLAADMKFALEKKVGSGIQLLFYKNESTTTNLNEQSVHFEIVAAPLPAGLLVAPVSVFPLLSKSRRGELFNLIQDYLLPSPNNTAAKTDQALDRKNLVASPDNVIIISVDGDRRFLMTVADGAAAGNVGFWYLETEPFSLTLLRKFGSSSDPNIAQVSDLVFRLGAIQKDFLSKLP